MTYLKRFPSLCLVGTLALGSVAFVNQTDAHETQVSKASDLRCVALLRDVGSGVEISGKVTSSRYVSGDYSMKVRKASGGNQALINMGGDFEVGSGRTVTLGQATLNGRASAFDTDLKITVDGKTMRCLSTYNDI